MKIIIVCVLILGSFKSMGQSATDFASLAQSSIVNKSDERGMSMALWLSDYFWEFAFNQTPGGDEALKQDMLRVLAEYNIFGVIIGARSESDVIRFADAEGIKNTLLLMGQDGVEYGPVPDEDVSEELDYILRIMKPMYAQLLGEMGANIQFCVFQKTNKNGDLIADPVLAENVVLSAGGIDFEWRLPMSALVPKKMCPEDSELMNGTWTFCPYHGAELQDVKE